MRDDQRASLIDVFGYVEDLDKEILATALPWSWQTQGELHEALAGGLGIDVAFLVGHTPLRLYVMGTEAWERTATDREIEQMGSVLDESIAADAQGLSTSFFDTDATGRPVPSAIADDRELGRLLDVLAKWGFVLGSSRRISAKPTIAPTIAPTLSAWRHCVARAGCAPLGTAFSPGGTGRTLLRECSTTPVFYRAKGRRSILRCRRDLSTRGSTGTAA